MATNLKDLLKRKEPKLRFSIEQIKNQAKPLLDNIVKTFPDYTLHAIEHKEEVIRVLELLIPPSLAKRLNKYEIYFLLAATYLHDVGMSDLQTLSEYKTDKALSKEEQRDFIRKNHHLRTAEFIKSEYQTLSIENQAQAEIISTIAMGHRKEDLFDTTTFNPKHAYDHSSINVPLLTALLRIADELDLTYKRTPRIMFDNLTPVNDRSIDEWERHSGTSGVIIDPDDPLTILCSANCNNPRIHRNLLDIERKIRFQLESLPKHLHQYAPCKDLPRTFKMDIRAKGYTPYDFRFSLDEEAIVTLLNGKRFYRPLLVH